MSLSWASVRTVLHCGALILSEVGGGHPGALDQESDRIDFVDHLKKSVVRVGMAGYRGRRSLLVAGLKPVVGDHELIFGCADHGVQALRLRVIQRGGEIRRRDDQTARLVERVGDVVGFGGHSSAGRGNGGFRHCNLRDELRATARPGFGGYGGRIIAPPPLRSGREREPIGGLDADHRGDDRPSRI